MIFVSLLKVWRNILNILTFLKVNKEYFWCYPCYYLGSILFINFENNGEETIEKTIIVATVTQ